jgi:dTDP-glucose 4,6-dehydratase
VLIADCDPLCFVDNNIVGTANLLEACSQTPVKRFLYVSTDEVYGDIPAPDYATEASPFRPSSPYSASKASADLLVQAWIKTYGFPGLIARPCNAYGPRQYPEKLIPKAIKLISENKPVPIYGDLIQIRDWIYG